MSETYKAAGVDIAAGEEAVESIKELVRSTYRPEVIVYPRCQRMAIGIASRAPDGAEATRGV